MMIAGKAKIYNTKTQNSKIQHLHAMVKWLTLHQRSESYVMLNTVKNNKNCICLTLSSKMR